MTRQRVNVWSWESVWPSETLQEPARYPLVLSERRGQLELQASQRLRRLVRKEREGGGGGERRGSPAAMGAVVERPRNPSTWLIAIAPTVPPAATMLCESTHGIVVGLRSETQVRAILFRARFRGLNASQKRR